MVCRFEVLFCSKKTSQEPAWVSAVFGWHFQAHCLTLGEFCAGPGVGSGDPDGSLQAQHIPWFLSFHLLVISSSVTHFHPVQYLYFGLGLANGPGVTATFVNLFYHETLYTGDLLLIKYFCSPKWLMWSSLHFGWALESRVESLVSAAEGAECTLQSIEGDRLGTSEN